jgi:hypothetical protein
MVLTYYCKSCKKKNQLKSKARDRFQLQSEYKADEISMRCTSCGTIEKRHINRITAETERYVLILCIAIALLLTALVWQLGFIASITFSIPFWIFFEAEKRARFFNRTMIRRK